MNPTFSRAGSYPRDSSDCPGWDGARQTASVPPSLLDALDLVHGIRKQQGRRGKGRDVRLWPWGRMTGWRVVHRVMQDAGLAGPHASPKGLRHGFGVQAVSKGHRTQHGAEVAGPRPTDHHGDLCRRRRRGGAEHRGQDVVNSEYPY